MLLRNVLLVKILPQVIVNYTFFHFVVSLWIIMIRDTEKYRIIQSVVVLTMPTSFTTNNANREHVFQINTFLRTYLPTILHTPSLSFILIIFSLSCEQPSFPHIAHRQTQELLLLYDLLYVSIFPWAISSSQQLLKTSMDCYKPYIIPWLEKRIYLFWKRNIEIYIYFLNFLIIFGREEYFSSLFQSVYSVLDMFASQLKAAVIAYP